MWASAAIRKHIFSMCLSFDGGAMTFGVVETRLHATPIAWASLRASGFYVVNVQGWALAGTQLDAGGMNSPHTIVDSGTTFTYVPTGAFHSLLAAIDAFCAQAGKCRGSPRAVASESKCYAIDDGALATFPSATIVLAGDAGAGDVTVTIAPEHLFVNMGWDNGAYCLAVYDNGNGGGVIGGNAMMGHDVVFDLEATRIGFADSTCVLDPSWIGGPDGATPSNTPSTTPTPSTTASNGTLPAGFDLGPAKDHLPSVASLVASGAFANVAAGLVLVAAVVGVASCALRRRGCELRVGGLLLKVEPRGAAAATAYARVGTPAGAPVTGGARGKGAAGAVGEGIAVEEEDDENFSDDDDLGTPSGVALKGKASV
jgi:hypothetical protein